MNNIFELKAKSLSLFLKNVMRASFFICFTVTAVYADNGGDSKPDTNDMCTESWDRFIENHVSVGDGSGHGPDIGSAEWMSAVEFKLGVRGRADLPEKGNKDWCRYIDKIVRNSQASLSETEAVQQTVQQAVQQSVNRTVPSFSCDKVKEGSIEAMICGDIELSALDHKLSGVYAAAFKLALNEHPPLLKSEQRGWVKGRDECWKSDDIRECVHDEYVHRIAELQATYRLLPFDGPNIYLCSGQPTLEIVVTFFNTTPATLIAERGDKVSLMYLQPSEGKYQGRNENFWTQHGKTRISWGYESPEMHCKKAS